MVGKTKFEISRDGTSLVVWCDDAELSRVQQFICNEISITAPTDLVTTIVLRNAAQMPVQAVSKVRDRIALAGCGLVAAAMTIVFLLGIERLFTLFTG